MQQITKTFNVYTFDELSDKVKKRVLDNFRKEDDYFWHEDNRKVLDQFCAIFRSVFTLGDWEYGYHNYIRYSFNEDNIANLKGVRLLKYLQNNSMTDEALKYENCPLTGYCLDYDILKPLNEFLLNPNESITFDDLIGKCLNAWLKACVKDYEYHYSDEGIIERIKDNEYMFLENGEIFNG